MFDLCDFSIHYARKNIKFSMRKIEKSEDVEKNQIEINENVGKWK